MQWLSASIPFTHNYDCKKAMANGKQWKENI